MTETLTPSVGVFLDTKGHILIRSLNEEGHRVTTDLTAIVEEMVDRKIMEHMKAWHSQNL